jgi:hypothetical protein
MTRTAAQPASTKLTAPALTNAIGNVFFSFAMRNKPIAAIAYSTGITGVPELSSTWRK